MSSLLSALPPALSSSLKQLSPFALGYSGGLDSRFLAYCAGLLKEEGVRCRLYHITGPHVPRAETDWAVAWANQHDLEITVVPLNPLDIPEVVAGGKERCYYCKRRLFDGLKTRIAAHPPFPGEATALCDGSNASDALVYRPGKRALDELGVRSPLAEAGLTKDRIRSVAREAGMDRPDQQARPCLLTRYAYGLSPGHEDLACLEAAESAVAGVLAAACPSDKVPDFRLRLTARVPGKNGMAAFRPELHVSEPLTRDMQDRLIQTITAHGFSPPEVVIAEAVSGHYDRASSPRRDRDD